MAPSCPFIIGYSMETTKTRGILCLISEPQEKTLGSKGFQLDNWANFLARILWVITLENLQENYSIEIYIKLEMVQRNRKKFSTNAWYWWDYFFDIKWVIKSQRNDQKNYLKKNPRVCCSGLFLVILQLSTQVTKVHILLICGVWTL